MDGWMDGLIDEYVDGLMAIAIGVYTFIVYVSERDGYELIDRYLDAR